MLVKILLLAIAVWLLLTILRNYRRSLDAEPPTTKNGNMVRCERCGIFVPENESLVINGKHYCCDEHVDPPVQ